MSEIYQTDAQFPTAFSEACFVMSMCKQFVLRLGMISIWSYSELTRIYENENMDHDMRSDLYVNNIQDFCDNVAGKNKVKYLGSFASDYSTAANQFEILEYHRDGTDFNHFVCGGGHGKVIYDPWSATGSLSVAKGKCIAKRLYQIL